MTISEDLKSIFRRLVDILYLEKVLVLIVAFLRLIRRFWIKSTLAFVVLSFF